MRLPGRAASHVHDDDEILARLLIIGWTLASGRTLRGDVPPQMLSAEELISFWADEQLTADQAPGPRPHTRPLPADPGGPHHGRTTPLEREQNAQNHGKCGLLTHSAQELSAAFRHFTLVAPSRIDGGKVQP
jgi:hypothetical protein